MTPRHVVVAMHLAEPGGPSRSLRPALERLDPDASLVIAVPGPGRVAREMADLGRVVALGHRPFAYPRRPSDVPRLARRLRAEIRRFRGLLRHERADLVVVATTTLPAFVIAARLEGVPCILYAAELHRMGTRSDLARFPVMRASTRLIARLATVTVACSPSVARLLRPGRPSVVMYPPVAPAVAGGDGDAFRAAHGIPATVPCIATMGNVSRGRGQDVAIRALADLRSDLPGARLVIAGEPHPVAVDQAYAAEIRALADELGVADAVHFCGFVEPAGLLAACDVFVNPAQYAESFGIAAMEALVAGRPVVSTAVGAVPELLTHDRHALLVEPGRPDAVAAAVRRLHQDQALAERLVAQGREHVLTSFSAEAVLPCFEDAVALALAERPVRATA